MAQGNNNNNLDLESSSLDLCCHSFMTQLLSLKERLALGPSDVIHCGSIVLEQIENIPSRPELNNVELNRT